MSTPFAAAFAEGDPATLAARLLAQLSAGQESNLGILYVSEPAAPALPQLVRDLVAGTGINSWVGGVGLGICAAGEEVYDRPAAAVMIAPLPKDSFRLFAATDDPAADLPRQHAGWIEQAQPSLALVHADPRCTDLVQAAIDTANASGAFLVGGLVSHRCDTPLLAGGGADALGKAGISGLLLTPEVSVATALTQGCIPIGPVRRIDEARDNVVMAIDGRPALTVFLDEIGPDLARDPRGSGEQRQDAGVAVEAVARDLAIGEEADQRDVAELLADHRGLDPGLTEQRGTARDAADINPGLGRPLQTAGQLP